MANIQFENVTYSYPHTRTSLLSFLFGKFSIAALPFIKKRQKDEYSASERHETTGPALADVTLEIAEGQFFGLLGHNGAGKTTLLRLLLGLLKQQHGNITVGSYVAGDSGIPRTLLSYLPESNGVYEKLTASQNLEFRARSANISVDIYKPRIQSLLKDFGLQERSNKIAGYLSKGLKQRLGLACALIIDPEILLLDEPTNGLDPESLHVIRHTLRSINENGTTIIMSSHDLNTVQELCTHIAIIQEGHIIHKGLLNNSVHSQKTLEEQYLDFTGGIQNEEK